MSKPDSTPPSQWTGLHRRLIASLRAFGGREGSKLLVLAVVIGLGTGLGAWVFAQLLEGVTGFCYRLVGERAGRHSDNLLLLVFLIFPAVGGLLVGMMTHFFAREAKGHGVPEVMDAIARRNGVIRPRVSIAKALASALTIGSGGSAGTEGPIVQIGAALGSSAGQFMGVSRRYLPMLIGCGTAAGIAAIFKAPIAGVLFALEIFLFDFSLRTFTPVVISAVMSATITQALAHNNRAILQLPPSFANSYTFAWWEVGNYVVLGLLAGVLAAAYTRSLYLAEDVFDDRLGKVLHPIVRPALGGLLLGGVGLLVLIVHTPIQGQPAIFGNGYPVVRDLLIPDSYEFGGELYYPVGLLLLLLVAKLIGTSLTLGSGGSGGVFSPALFMGACLGGTFGLLLQRMGMDVNPLAYAVVGMAAVFAGSTHAYLTGIVMLFEMTQTYRVMVPVMLAATVATVISQLIKRESIYTEKLKRRGVQMSSLADMTLLRRLTVAQVSLAPATTVRSGDPLAVLISKAAAAPTADFVVVDDQDRYAGMVVAEDLRTALLEREAVPLLLVGELMRPEIPVVRLTDSLADVHDTFSRHEVSAMPVLAPDGSERVAGLVTRSALMRCYQGELARGTGFGGRKSTPRT
ncbi:MAG: Voltage-gated ClC-type chloride channel ClcB [Phycisphaerae bacterium]|nr:Voltage-gated ClC-type chloride channel ClcB [Phycisphaerae bacterium]